MNISKERNNFPHSAATADTFTSAEREDTKGFMQDFQIVSQLGTVPRKIHLIPRAERLCAMIGFSYI